MSLLQSHMSNMNPDIRQLLMGWITMLKSIPGVNLVNYLPEYKFLIVSLTLIVPSLFG